MIAPMKIQGYSKRFLWGYWLVAGLWAVPVFGQEQVEFNRDIRPILADRCFHCHGPDEAARKADLRLDLEDGAKAKVIVAGDVDASELIARITSDDIDDLMPPPASQKPALTANEVELFRRWIEQGAEWEAHWAFVAPVAPELPSVDSDWATSPIDAFLLDRMKGTALSPSPMADKATLLRRVSLDLTGLPPTLEALDAFLADESPDAYANAVDSLLASTAYGEHMAGYWLDGARYADTNGYQNDFGRNMWPWRDWVIDAFNANMPFDQFTIEQIAGDLLPDATVSQRIASGFNRNHRTVTEGGSINEEWRVENIVDRVETTSTVYLGLSMGCARCHEHKYDPISQKEFYEFFAFFNNTTDEGHYNEVRGNVGATVSLPQPEDLKRIAELDEAVRAARKAVTAAKAERDASFKEWMAGLEAGGPKASPEVTLDLDGNLLVGARGRAAASVVSPAVYPGATWAEDGIVGTALTLEGTDTSYVDLGQSVTFERDRPFSISAWVKPEGAGAVLSKMNDGDAFRGVDILLGGEGEIAVHMVSSWSDNAIKVVSASKLAMGKWSHVGLTYDGSSKASGVTIYVNGRPTANGTVEVDALSGSIHTEEPLRIGRRSASAFLKGQVSRVAFFDEALNEDAMRGLVDIALADSMRRDASEARVALVKELYERRAGAVVDEKRELVRAAMQAKSDYEKNQVPTVMVMEEREEPRPTYRLIRGAYDAPDTSVELGPKVPAFLPPLPEGAPANRLGLAKWLVDPAHPLTARVTVNRVWQQLFGTGLVRTPEDFGQQGEPPTHPKLLDWLAVDFVRSGWDMKALQKKIVMSSTYRQSSVATPEHRSVDPENRLLARAPRFRLRAEILRDNALAVSGLLVNETGGPSVKPYQPEGLWEELAGGASQGPYTRSEGDDLYRRSLYTYRKRTVPPPMLTTFDAPSWELCWVRRGRTNTPLQSLALLNDETYVEAARSLATRMLLDGGDEPDARVAYGFRSATGRVPSDREQDVLVSGLKNYVATYSADTKAAEALLSHGELAVPDDMPKGELAAYTALASVILNLDETITRE